jgi:hypothetical protein
MDGPRRKRAGALIPTGMIWLTVLNAILNIQWLRIQKGTDRETARFAICIRPVAW